MSDAAIRGILQVLLNMQPQVDDIHAVVTEEPDSPNAVSEALEALTANTGRIAAEMAEQTIAIREQNGFLQAIAEHLARRERDGRP